MYGKMLIFIILMMIDFVLADVMPVLGRCLPNLLICQYTMVDGNHRADVKPIFSICCIMWQMSFPLSVMADVIAIFIFIASTEYAYNSGKG